MKGNASDMWITMKIFFYMWIMYVKNVEGCRSRLVCCQVASETRRWPGGEGQAIGRQSAKSQNELNLNERSEQLCLGAGSVSPISWDQESREVIDASLSIIWKFTESSCCLPSSQLSTYLYCLCKGYDGHSLKGDPDLQLMLELMTSAGLWAAPRQVAAQQVIFPAQQSSVFWHNIISCLFSIFLVYYAGPARSLSWIVCSMSLTRKKLMFYQRSFKWTYTHVKPTQYDCFKGHIWNTLLLRVKYSSQTKE